MRVNSSDVFLAFVKIAIKYFAFNWFLKVFKFLREKLLRNPKINLENIYNVFRIVLQEAKVSIIVTSLINRSSCYIAIHIITMN